ncbi:glycosyltransferase family A protein [Halomonas sp. JS92-SW72]|uniref:glycosyltransferase family A protein n=1 Tax=Halomonas sp. JS92-SW72 TaxID=2306583 RepID=UPI000E5A37D7|nr:glycosyltransferase family A protein [Halomonas sp. JS92-SW72]AXY42939.1 glycosyltransferase family 2 protein [Halomonas sp. JS92-SW72]
MSNNDEQHDEKTPFFSVIIPVHNKADYLEKSLACVHAQIFRNFEVIAVDDCSTDGSLEILQRHERAGVLRLYRRDKPGPGGYAARNFGVSKARAEWVIFFDADDAMRDDHLSVFHSVIARNGDLEFICNNYVMKVGEKIVGKNSGIQSGRYRRIDGLSFFAHNDFVHMNSACMRRGLFDRLGGFPEGRYRRGGDVYFWVKLLICIEEFYYCEKVTTEWHLDNSFVTKCPDNLTVHPLADFIREEEPRLDPACDMQLRRIINRKIIAWATEKKLQGRQCYHDFPHVSLKGLGCENMMRMLALALPASIYQVAITMKRAWRAG